MSEVIDLTGDEEEDMDFAEAAPMMVLRERPPGCVVFEEVVSALHEVELVDFVERNLPGNELQARDASATLARKACSFGVQRDGTPGERIPPVLTELWHDAVRPRLEELCIAAEFPNQATVLVFDTHGRLHDHHDPNEDGAVIATVSLGAAVEMRFGPKNGKGHLDEGKVTRGQPMRVVELPAGSLHVLFGKARNSYTHGITQDAMRAMRGRGVRVSVTFRNRRAGSRCKREFL